MDVNWVAIGDYFSGTQNAYGDLEIARVRETYRCNSPTVIRPPVWIYISLKHRNGLVSFGGSYFYTQAIRIRQALAGHVDFAIGNKFLVLRRGKDEFTDRSTTSDQIDRKATRKGR